MFHVSERKEYPTLALFSNENLKDALFLSPVVEAKLMRINKQKVCSENNMKMIISIFKYFG